MSHDPGLPPPAPGARRWRASSAWLGVIPSIFLLLTFGRLVANPSALLVRADRPTVDRARVVDAPPGNDLTRQFLPLHRWIGEEWRRLGRLPTWDDRGFGGRPLVGNPQAGLWYPPVWLAWAIPAPATLGWITVGHLAFAGAGMLRLGRTLGLNPLGRITAAGTFILGPYLLAHVAEGHYPHVWAVCWYPWATDALLGTARGERRSGLRLSLSLAAMTLVGHPQEGYYFLIATAIAALAVVLRAGTAGRWIVAGTSRAAVARRLAKAVVGVIGLMALVIGLTAVEVIPAQRVAPYALRGERPTSREAGQYHPSLLNALQVLNTAALGGPHDYFGPDNYWETVVGVGLVPLALAAVGARTGGRRHLGWVALVVGSGLFALGRSGGLFLVLFEVVPGMDRFRVPARSLFLAALGVAILAGRGVDALAGARLDSPVPERLLTSGAGRDGWRGWLGRWLLGLGVLGVALGWGTWRTRAQGLTPEDQAPTVAAAVERASRRGGGSDGDRVALGLARLATDPVFLLAVGGLTLGLACGTVWPTRRGGVAVGLGLLALGELASTGYRVLPTAPASAFVNPGPVAVALARQVGRADDASATLADWPRPVIRADASVVSDLEAQALGLAKTDINDSFQIDHAAQVYGRLYELSRPRPSDRDHPATGPEADRRRQDQGAILAGLGVAALAANRTTPRALALIDALGWPAQRPAVGPTGRGLVIAANPYPLPWAYVVPRAPVVAEPGEPRVDLLPTGNLGRQEGVRGADRVALAGPDRVAVTVATTEPSRLILRQTWLPGWTATVDGQRWPIGRGQFAQQVVRLPSPGRHVVALRYDPPGLRLGAAVSVATLGVWVMLWVRRRPGPAGDARL